MNCNFHLLLLLNSKGKILASTGEEDDPIKVGAEDGRSVVSLVEPCYRTRLAQACKDAVARQCNTGTCARFTAAPKVCQMITVAPVEIAGKHHGMFVSSPMEFRRWCSGKPGQIDPDESWKVG